MDSDFNKHVATGLKGLFGKTEHSNCTIVFTVPLYADIVQKDSLPTADAIAKGGDAQKRSGVARDSGPASTTAAAITGDGHDSIISASCNTEGLGAHSSPHTGAGGSAAAAQAEVRVVGEPLPAHTVVLCLASERFQTQVARWSDDSAAPGPSGKRLAVLGARAPVAEQQQQQQQQHQKQQRQIQKQQKQKDKQKQQKHESATQPPVPPLPLQRPPPLQLRVPLGSEEELPAALAAIKFAYTGRIEAGSIREALQVWKQADYLQMKGCMEACVAAVREKLAAGSAAPKAAALAGQQGTSAGGGEGALRTATAPAAAAAAAAAAAVGSAAEPDNSRGSNGAQGSVSSAGSKSVSAAAAATPPVLQLYGCTQLWPDPEQEPAFAALLTEAKPQLVAHFGDVMEVLNEDQYYDQMLALPAVGLEALLESDDFGTDSESSVVLVLAEWMKKNYSSTDAGTRRRLCGLLRLCQCTRAYTDWILPALALDHLLHPGSPLGWFPITPQRAGCITYYGTASEREREMLLESSGGAAACPEAWFSPTRRRQCVPPDGISFSFSFTREELCKEFGSLEAEELGTVLSDGNGDPPGSIWAAGLQWFPFIEFQQGTSEGNLWLESRLPRSFSHNDCAHKQSFVKALIDMQRPIKGLRSRLLIHVYNEFGLREEKQVWEFKPKDSVMLGIGHGSNKALPLAGEPPPPHQQQHQTGEQELELEKQRRAREAAVATQWGRYLRDGSLTGRVVVMRPDHDAEEDDG